MSGLLSAFMIASGVQLNWQASVFQKEEVNTAVTRMIPTVEVIVVRCIQIGAHLENRPMYHLHRPLYHQSSGLKFLTRWVRHRLYRYLLAASSRYLLHLRQAPEASYIHYLLQLNHKGNRYIHHHFLRQALCCLKFRKML
jgi:hypothetical protein